MHAVNFDTQVYYCLFLVGNENMELCLDILCMNMTELLNQNTIQLWYSAILLEQLSWIILSSAPWFAFPGKLKESDDVDSNAGQSGFKDQKAAKEKSQSGSSHNWNTLFLGPSVVADLVADKYGVSKQDVLTGDGQQSAAVRLALGETQIVAETR